MLGSGGLWFGETVRQCDHEVGEKAGVGGAHRVGEEVDVGGGAQQTCVVEVICVMWRRAISLSGGYFGVRRLLTDDRRTRVVLLHSMRQLGY